MTKCASASEVLPPLPKKVPQLVWGIFFGFGRFDPKRFGECERSERRSDETIAEGSAVLPPQPTKESHQRWGFFVVIIGYIAYA